MTFAGPRDGGTAHRAGASGDACMARRQNTEGRGGVRPLLSLEFQRVRQSSHHLGLACLNDFGRLQAGGVDSSSLGPSPRTTEVEECCLLGCMGQTEECGSGWVILHMAGCSWLGLCSKSQLALGGAVFPTRKVFLFVLFFIFYKYQNIIGRK